MILRGTERFIIKGARIGEPPASGTSQGQFLAVDPFGGVHVVWHDDTPGNLEVYYKKFSK
jgi:hypothetical protein